MVKDRPFIILLIVALALLAAASMAWAASHALKQSDDLLRRAEEVALFVRGLDPYVDPDLTYPPSALPVFTALIAPLPSGWLRPCWFLLNVAALGAVCALPVWLWGRSWPRWMQVAFVLAVIAMKPARGGIGLGQFHLLPMALVLLSMAALRASREWLAGVLLAVALIKPTMALPLVGLWVARQWGRALAAVVVTQAALVGMASIWLSASPWRLMREWLEQARGQEAAGLIDVPSLVERFSPGLGISAGVISVVIVMGCVGLTIAWRQRSELALATLCTFTSAVMAYHRPYDLVLLVPALALLIDRAVRAGETRQRLAWSLAAAGFGLALIVPNHPLEAIGWASVYEWTFIGVMYAVLGLVLATIWWERCESRLQTEQRVRKERPRGPAGWQGPRGQVGRAPGIASPRQRFIEQEPDQFDRASS